MTALRSLSWLSEGRAGHSRERAEIADGTLFLDPPDTAGIVALRFCPTPPAGVRAADLPGLADADPAGSPAWHRNRAYDPAVGAPLGLLYDRYLAYQLIQEARERIGHPLPRDAIRAAGFRLGGSDGDGPAVYQRRASHGHLALSLTPAAVTLEFDRLRTRKRTLVAQLRASHDEAGQVPVLWPEGWDRRSHLVRLVLFAADWAERCGLTGPADLVLKRPTQPPATPDLC